jgi:hypothetical protein
VSFLFIWSLGKMLLLKHLLIFSVCYFKWLSFKLSCTPAFMWVRQNSEFTCTVYSVPTTLQIVEALLQMYIQPDKLLQYSSAVKLFLSSAFDVSVLKFTSWSAAFLSSPTRITVYIYIIGYIMHHRLFLVLQFTINII